MRYRTLDPAGDMTFGQGRANFLVNSPECVGQAVRTRLQLLRGEWFLDKTAGVPYATDVFGKVAQATRDRAIRACILGTTGVTEIVVYSSVLDGRSYRVQATINTLYGQTTVEADL